MAAKSTESEVLIVIGTRDKRGIHLHVFAVDKNQGKVKLQELLFSSKPRQERWLFVKASDSYIHGFWLYEPDSRKGAFFAFEKGSIHTQPSRGRLRPL